MKRDLEIRRVLIVDDEPELRDVLSLIVKHHNIQTDIAADGREALEKLRQQDFHAVLCDIMMPEMNGMECLAQAQVEGLVAPFIFVTGQDDSKRMLQAIRLGALDFISKPFNSQDVMDVLFRVLEIGTRRSHMLKSVLQMDPELSERIKKDEKYISLMKATNNMKRTGST